MTDLYVQMLERNNRKLRAQVEHLTATVQATRDAVTPHNQEWGWQCPCCAAVAKALGGESGE